MGEAQLIDRPLRSVFVGNIPYEVTEEKLKEIFSEVGPVLSLKLVYDRESGKPKGFGFCEYKDVETAMSAMRNLNGYEINGRILRVDNAGAERHRMAEMNIGGIGGSGIIGPGQGNGPRHMEEQQQQHPFMMGRGDREQDGPPPPEKTPEVISKAVASLPPEQMFELMKQMKLCIQNNPNEARTMLLQNPQLAYALLQAQVVMKIIDPAAALAMLHQDNGVPVGNLLPEGQTGSMMMGPSSVPPPPAPRSGFGMPPPPQQQQSENPWIAAASNTGGAPLMPINPPGPFGTGPPIGVPNPGQGGDLDFRQMQMDPRIRNPPPPPHQDLDLRTDGRGGGGPDRFQMDPRHRGDRDLRDTDRDMRMGRERAMRDSDLRDRDPRIQNPMLKNPSDPRARARAERDQQTQGQKIPPASVLPASMAAGFGPGTTDTEKAALIMQVLQLSEEQISMLPPEQRQSILVLKEQIAKAGNR